jgi:hypothetical protein
MLTTQTRNLNIFHCLHCGAIQYRLPGQENPVCCELPMVHAAAHTVRDAEDCEVAAGDDDPTLTSDVAENAWIDE